MDYEAMFGIPSDYYSLEEAPQHYPEDVQIIMNMTLFRMKLSLI